MVQNLAKKSARLSFRGLCMSNGYNSKMLAEELGISETVLCDRIRGRTPWRWTEVIAVCKVLGISFDDFAKCYPCS